MLGAVLHSESAGNAKRVKAVQVAPGGQHIRCAQQVAAGCRVYVTAIEGTEQAFDFAVLAHQHKGLGKRIKQLAALFAGRQTAEFCCLGCTAALDDGINGRRCDFAYVLAFGHGAQHIGILRVVERLADHMQTVRYQCVFKLQHLHRQLLNRVLHLLHAVCVGVYVPHGKGGRQVNGCGLGLNQFGQARHVSGLSRTEIAPTVNRGFQIHQTAVQTGCFHRRRQITDERRAASAFGNRAF